MKFNITDKADKAPRQIKYKQKQKVRRDKDRIN